MRTKLTGNQTFYLSTTGSDSNDGLSSSTPWGPSINGALNRVLDGYDFDGYGGIVTLQLADGTYTDGIHYAGHPVGVNNSQNIFIKGNESAPWQCMIQPSGSGVPAI